jgi:hypothetical protein
MDESVPHTRLMAYDVPEYVAVSSCARSTVPDLAVGSHESAGTYAASGSMSVGRSVGVTGTGVAATAAGPTIAHNKTRTPATPAVPARRVSARSETWCWCMVRGLPSRERLPRTDGAVHRT